MSSDCIRFLNLDEKHTYLNKIFFLIKSKSVLFNIDHGQSFADQDDQTTCFSLQSWEYLASERPFLYLPGGGSRSFSSLMVSVWWLKRMMLLFERPGDYFPSTNHTIST